MRMLVVQRRVAMPMRMRFVDRAVVVMLVVGVVCVQMRMFQRFVLVIMLMPFGQVQPEAHRHQ